MKSIPAALALALALGAPAFADEPEHKKPAVDPVAGVEIAEGRNAQEPVPGGEFEEGLAAYDKGAYANAYMLWIPAAVRGDARAQFNLGVMALEGRGGTPDLVHALAWISMAVDNLSDPANKKMAVELRDKVSTTLTPDQVKQAEELKQQWVNEHKEALKQMSSPNNMQTPVSEAPLPGQLTMPTPIPGKPISEQPQIEFGKLGGGSVGKKAE